MFMACFAFFLFFVFLSFSFTFLSHSLWFCVMEPFNTIVCRQMQMDSSYAFQWSQTIGEVVLNLSKRHHSNSMIKEHGIATDGRTLGVHHLQIFLLLLYVPRWNILVGDEFISKWLLIIYWLQSKTITLFQPIVNRIL